MQKNCALMVLAVVVACAVAGCSQTVTPRVKPKGSQSIMPYLSDYKAAVHSWGKLVAIHNKLCYWVHFPEAVTDEKRRELMDEYARELDNMNSFLRSVALEVEANEITEAEIAKARTKSESDVYAPEPLPIPEFVPGKYLENYWETERVEGRPVLSGSEKLRLEDELIRTAKRRVKELPWFDLPPHPKDSPLARGI